ncbi:XerC Integrase, partial [uncultured Caudovirales phage]
MSKKTKGPYLELNRSGVYEIRWSEPGQQRSRSRSTGARDLSIAQKVLANFILLGDAEVAKAAPDRPMLVMEAMGDPDEGSEPTDSYWHEHVLREVNGKDTQRFAIRKLHIHFGHMAIRDVRPKDITAFVDKRRKGTIGRPSQDGTIARELSVLSAAIRHQLRAKRISADDTPMIELPKGGEPKDRWLTPEEADRLLDAAMEGRSSKDRLPRVYKFVVLALTTASRKTALLELRKDQIDMDRGMIRLNPHGRRQTKKRRPLVPVSSDLMPILKRIMDEAAGEFLLDHPGAIRTAFNSAVRRANLDGVTPHTLR